MELTSPNIIKELLTKYNARPSKGLGQNFLIDKNVLNKIIETADLKPSDIILEIGPGIGTLTQKLAKNTKKIIAIEKDKTMVEILKETLAGYKNIEIINADILKIEKLQKFKNYKVVANIPYYITSPVIRKFLEAENKPDFMVLMVQKEVAQRICSKPPDMTHSAGSGSSRATRGMSLLSVSVQFYAEPKIVSYVSKNCFWPSPKVDSAIIKITPRGQTSRPAGGLTSPDLFFRVVKAGFSQPRKQLAGNLSKNLNLSKEKTAEWMQKNKIDPKQRAETLSIEDWKNLIKTVDNF